MCIRDRTSGVNANGAVDVVDNTITFSGALPVGAATMYGIYAQGGLDDVRVEGNDVDGGGIANNGGTIPPSGVYEMCIRDRVRACASCS